MYGSWTTTTNNHKFRVSNSDFRLQIIFLLFFHINLVVALIISTVFLFFVSAMEDIDQDIEKNIEQDIEQDRDQDFSDDGESFQFENKNFFFKRRARLSYSKTDTFLIVVRTNI